MVKLLGHRQTKGAATDIPNLTPPRHISTLPRTIFSGRRLLFVLSHLGAGPKKQPVNLIYKGFPWLSSNRFKWVCDFCFFSLIASPSGQVRWFV